MAQQQNITKRFADRPWILKLKMWTPKRGVIEIEAGHCVEVGAMIAFMSMLFEPTDEEKRMIAEFHKAIVKEHERSVVGD